MKFVAEMSANHLGSLSRAEEIVRQAKNAGATHLKLQTFNPEQMAIKGHTIESGPWSGLDLRSLYEEACAPREWHKVLFDLGREIGITVFSTPFHPDDVEFLETLGCPLYKIASCELGYVDLLEAVKQTGRPAIISTGMATEEEIHKALSHLGDGVTILKCTSAYPADYRDANLATLPYMALRFNKPVGVSDHTIDHTVAITAASLGASMIEKHFTLSRQDFGPDSAFSIEPKEFREMVDLCTKAQEALGGIEFGPKESEKDTEKLKRACYFARDIKAGEILTKEDIKYCRPNHDSEDSYTLDQPMPSTAKEGQPLRVA